MWNRTELEVDNYYYMVAIEFIKYYIESDAILFTLLLEFTHVAMWAVDRKHGLQITDYRLTCMSCDTARHHVTVILLGWL